MATTQTLTHSESSLEKSGSFCRRALSFPVLMGALLVTGSFVGAEMNVLDPDTWWHATVGQQILATHHFPQVDAYSWTATGTPWIAYEWLGEILMGAVARIDGLWSSTILLVTLAAILVVLMYAYASLRCKNSKAAFLACLTLLPVLAAFFTLRPQLLGYIFLVITLICLELFRKGHTRPLWLLPLVFLCWINTHGSFVFGFAAVGTAWLSGQVEFEAGGLVAQRWTRSQSVQLALTLLACVLMLPLTPYGTHQAAYPLIMALSQPVNVNNIQEWQPLGSALFVGKVFLATALLFFVTVLVQRPKLRLDEVCLALFGVYAACVHLRFLVLFCTLFVALWALLLARWIPAYEPERDHPAINAVLMVLIVLGLIHFFPTHEDLDRRLRSDYPTAAVSYLRQHPVQGRLLNEYGWGGYLIWATGTRPDVFIDGRADVYEYAGVLSDYLGIMRLQPDTLRLMEKYGVRVCLIQQDSALATLLGALPDWKRVYADNVAAVFVREDAAPAHALAAPKPAGVLAARSLQ